MGEAYPADPNELVVYKYPDSTFVTTSLGVAIWKGDRSAIESYLKNGADLKAPIWYAGETEIHRTAPAHMAINAIYQKYADPDFLGFILEKGADANAMETFYAHTAEGIRSSQWSVLYHAVNSEIPTLTRFVLDAGVSDLSSGGVGDDGTKSSPMIAAVLRGNVEAAGLLIDAGADPSVGVIRKDGNNSTPRNMAEGLLTKTPNSERAKRTEAIVALIDKHSSQDQ
jgi:hypothetical protein